MNTALQTYDAEAQRLALLEQYNPHEHLLQWTTFDKRVNRSVVVHFLPANWRLYELHLKYPQAKFDIDIIHMDTEHDFCIIRAKLFIGESYETAERRAVAHKQGKLSQLDRVETAAKARAARDFGISTEFALDCEDAPEGEVVGTIVLESHQEAQETASSVEAPRILPQPTQRPSRPVQSSPDGKLLPSQFNALKSLYLRLNQELPPDLDQWTFEQARATIVGLQSQLKQAS